MSPESLSEASSSVFLAVTFALLGFCISGTLGLTCSMFYIFTLLSAFIACVFSAVLFCYSVFWEQ